MSDDVLRDLQYLHDLRQSGATDEEVSRAQLDLTLQAAGPHLADAVRLCALPAWFDEELLALLRQPLPPQGGETAAALIEQIANLSFVLPRLRGGGYTYHEASRERLLDWWRAPENRPRYAQAAERLAGPYLALAHEQAPRIKGPGYREALAALDQAWPNLAAAWQALAETENGPLLRDFAYALADYFMHRRLTSEWIAWTEIRYPTQVRGTRAQGARNRLVASDE